MKVVEVINQKAVFLELSVAFCFMIKKWYRYVKSIVKLIDYIYDHVLLIRRHGVRL